VTELANGSFIFIRQATVRSAAFTLDTVSFDNGRENRKAVSILGQSLLTVHVHPSDFDLLARPRDINQVTQQNDIFVTRHSAGRDRARTLL